MATRKSEFTKLQGENMKTVSGIYAIRNRVNQKVYVGLSISVFSRWATHYHKLEAGEHDNIRLQTEWKQFPGQFTFEILEVCSQTVLGGRELYWIGKLRACNPEYGYNIVGRCITSPAKEKAVKKEPKVKSKPVKQAKIKVLVPKDQPKKSTNKPDWMAIAERKGLLKKFEPLPNT